MKNNFLKYSNKRYKKSIIKFISKILRQPNDIQIAKNNVLEFLIKKYGYKVAYGQFKDMKLDKEVWWSKNDLITKILGVYEKHIVDQLIFFSQKGSKTFIDIGAADGYFPIGLVISGLFKKSFAYEISSKGRTVLEKNIINNNCSDRVNVRSQATFDSLNNIISNTENPTILIDIEGSEFDFLSLRMLDLLKSSNVICELHPWLVIHGEQKQKDLLKDASKFFDVKLIQREFYNPNQFDDLNKFGDDERLLAFSEKRSRNTNWLVLQPKSSSIIK